MIIDHVRDLSEFCRLYLKRPMHDGLYTLEHILKNPLLFCFYDEITSELKGFIFINADKSNNLYLSGVSVRKNFFEVVKAINKICDAFPTDMYAETDKKEAILVLKKAGFKQVNKNLYVRNKIFYVK